MEGTLWKWTNYFSGWQPRWFILENDILSYYRSQEDVINGCRGSIKMSVCDVIVHPTDSSRLDLSIPGEAHFYVKAATAQERQQWLVALGSCKACLMTTSGHEPKSVEIPEDELRGKRSELRLYCDLLVQKVSSIKEAMKDKEKPDLQKLNEATSLLSETCDTFIKTLEDCMHIANAGGPLTPGAHGSVPSSPSRRPFKATSPWGPMQRSTSIDSPNNRSPSSNVPVKTEEEIIKGYIPNARLLPSSRNVSRQNSRSRTPSTSSDHAAGDSRSKNGWLKGEVTEDEGEEDIPKLPNFFSTMELGFQDVKLQEDGGIPTLPFLQACRPILAIFDKLSSTAFAPVKMDIAGNIRKIQHKYSTDPDKFNNLQALVLYEVEHRQNTHTNSATNALLWLKRALEYVKEFLSEFMMSQEELHVSANAAYAKSLRQYHSFIVRGIYALAVQAIPSRSGFLSHLAVNLTDANNPDFEKSLMKDVEDYVTAMDVHLRLLNDFYQNKGLNSDEQV